MKPVMPVGGNTGNACERQQNDDDVHKCARLRRLRRSGGCAAVLLLVKADTGGRALSCVCLFWGIGQGTEAASDDIYLVCVCVCL